MTILRWHRPETFTLSPNNTFGQVAMEAEPGRMKHMEKANPEGPTRVTTAVSLHLIISLVLFFHNANFHI